MRYVDPEIFATWSARLAAEAEGLDWPVIRSSAALGSLGA